MTSKLQTSPIHVLEGRAASSVIFAAIAVGLFASLAWFYSSFYALHHDLAGSLLSGRLAVTLGDAFDDYSLYFPPAERAWFSLAARLSDATGLGLDLAVVMMTSAAVLFSTGLAYCIRRQTVGASPIFLIVSIAVLVALPILFKNIFGLREHLVALGLWPYLVLRLSDSEDRSIGWKTRALLGLWMGATLLLKYLYSIVVLLVELVDAAIQRRPFALFRMENIIAGAIVAAYLFAWLVLDPSQREAIGVIVSAIDANLTSTRTNALQAAMHIALSLFFLIAARLFNIPLRVTLIGLALVIGAIIVAWIQSRWYTHHVFPITMAYVAWWWMASSRLKLWAHVVAALFIANPIITEFGSTRFYQASVSELDTALEDAGVSVEGKRVGVLIMHLSPYNQYLASHDALRWNASMNNSYIAAELKPFDVPENAGVASPPISIEEPGRAMLHDEMLRLWEDMPPDVLILDYSTSWPLRHIKIDWERAYSEDARFQAIFSQYRPVFEHEGERLKFRYYVRAD